MRLGPWVNVVPVTSEPMRRPSLDPAPLAALAPDLVVEVLETATSTNAVAAERARAGAPEGLVVVAEHQTAGRGRLDRTWQTPPRSAADLLAGAAPDVPLARLAVAAAAHRATRSRKALRAEGYDAGVKWPNDVLIGDRKVAGILVERIETPDGPAAVVGVGLNVSPDRRGAAGADRRPRWRSRPGVEPDRTALLVTAAALAAGGVRRLAGRRATRRPRTCGRRTPRPA